MQSSKLEKPNQKKDQKSNVIKSFLECLGFQEKTKTAQLAYQICIPPLYLHLLYLPDKYPKLSAGSLTLSLKYLTVWMDTKLLHSNYSELSVAIQYLVLSLLFTVGVISPCIRSCQSTKLLFCLNTS